MIIVLSRTLHRIATTPAKAFVFVCLALVLALLPGTPSRAEEPAIPCAGHSLMPKFAASGALAAMEAKAAEEPNGGAKLFRLERAGVAPSFLYGTMHMTDPRVTRLAPTAETAFAAARRIVIETTDILDENGVAGVVFSRPDLTLLPDGKTLDDIMTPAEIAGITPGLNDAGLPIAAVRTLQPWFFAMGLAVPACESARQADGAKVLDVALALRAKAEGKAVAGLETVTEQLEAIASMPMELQVASLVSTLALKDRLPDLFETMIELYAQGRIAMITPMSDRLLPPDQLSPKLRADYTAFEERIIVRRNHVMAQRLAPLLGEGGNFVAVGALHLPGREGLVELLRAEGYAVTVVE